MKFFTLSFLFLASIVQANDFDSKIIKINGYDSYESFTLTTLSTDKIKNKISKSQVCKRKKHIGHKEICGPTKEEICTREFTPGEYVKRICKTQVVQSCKNEPTFKDIEYSCNLDSSKEEFKDKIIKTRINLVIENQSNIIPRSACLIYFEQQEQSMSYKGLCSEYLIKVAEDKSITTKDGIKERNIKVELREFKNLIAPVASSISNIEKNGNILSFKTGNLDLNSRYALRLSVTKKSLFSKDKSLIDRDLLQSEYMFEKQSEISGIVRVNFQYLINTEINSDDQLDVKISIRLIDDLSSMINLGNFTPAISAQKILK